MSIADQSVMNEGYQNQFHVAGFYRGKWWLRNVATPLQMDRLRRAGNKDRELVNKASLEEAMEAVVSILCPTKAKDPASIRKCWEELRGDIPYADRAAYVVGFLEAASETAHLRSSLWSLVDGWMRSLSSPQLIKLAEFVGRFPDDERVDGENLYPDGCEDAYQVAYFAIHGKLPCEEAQESRRKSRVWFLDSFEHASSGCLFNEWVQAFLIAVISEFRRGDLWETIDGAYHDIYYREER